MKRIIIIIYAILINLILVACTVTGQEYAGPLRYNSLLSGRAAPHSLHNAAARTTATLANPLLLPFFEDFTTYGIYPDSTKWTDYEVYINNTMGVRPISRGVATFDALDWRGIPYDSFSNTSHRYSDSLTSQPINMSLDQVTPGDSIYFSFFYQPQGNGFHPSTGDSLLLYFKSHFGGFVKVWSKEGSSLQPFTQVMIPIADSLYFDSFFQFRFVNIAALQWADAVWNIDYIKLDKNRSMADTIVNDIGFTADPNFLLNDYTSMPYRQFFPSRSAETVLSFIESIRNNYAMPQSISYAYTATALNNGAILQPPVTNTTTVPAFATQALTQSSYSSAIPLTSIAPNEKVVFENKFYIQSIAANDPPQNDTIIKEQVFDNYLAYDDGSAEKSYYLNLYPTLPGKIAVEYHLNQPDTLRGMAIYFGRQIPFAANKFFSITVYSALAGINGATSDNVLHQQDFYSPGYADSINHFWVYTFDNPLVLPAGTFYMGTIQPAESGSDSLYIGLDVNRIGSNHAYYNVFFDWNPSLISGALMMRPLLGQHVTGTAVTNLQVASRQWQVFPNPATNVLQFTMPGDAKATYRITDVQGRTILQGAATNGSQADIADLIPGMYFVQLICDGVPAVPQKIIKL